MMVFSWDLVEFNYEKPSTMGIMGIYLGKFHHGPNPVLPGIMV